MDTGRLQLATFCWSGNQLAPAPAADCLRLFWIRTGCGTIVIDRRSEQLRPYSLVSVGPGAARIQPAENISGCRLEIAGDFLADSFPVPVFPRLAAFFAHLREPVLRIHFCQRARCEAEWLLQRMLREDRDSPEFFWASIRLTLGQFLLLCYQQWLLNEQEMETVSAGAETVVKVLCGYIDEHLNEDFGLKRLSARAGYAPSYLSSLFSKVNGQGLTEYISRKRIARAQDMLRGSNLKIIEICYRVGFKDLAHFNRTFKRFVGITPNQFRQSDSGMRPLDGSRVYPRVNPCPAPQPLEPSARLSA